MSTTCPTCHGTGFEIRNSDDGLTTAARVPRKDGQLPSIGAGAPSAGSVAAAVRTMRRASGVSGSLAGRHVLRSRIMRRAVQSSVTRVNVTRPAATEKSYRPGSPQSGGGFRSAGDAPP